MEDSGEYYLEDDPWDYDEYDEYYDGCECDKLPSEVVCDFCIRTNSDSEPLKGGL